MYVLCVRTYIYMCVYIRMCVRKYICVYVNTYVCMYIRMCVRIYVCMYVYMYVCTYVYRGVSGGGEWALAPPYTYLAPIDSSHANKFFLFFLFFFVPSFFPKSQFFPLFSTILDTPLVYTYVYVCVCVYT